MSFILRLTLAIFILFILEFIFVKKLKNSFSHIFRNNSKIFTWAKWLYLVFINIYPTLLLIYWAYSYFIDNTFIVRVENVFFDFLAVYPFWVLGAFTLQVILFFIVIDLLKFFLRIFFRKDKIRSLALKANFVVIIFFIFYVPARVIIDYHITSVRITEYFKENLHESLEGFKIALISDTQADHYTDEKRLNNFLEKVNAANPDLILIAGDLITSTPFHIKRAADQLSRLKSRYGIYSCVGDHDNWAYRGNIERSRRELTDAMNKVNIPLLHNVNRTINVNDSKIGITFVTHTYSENISEVLLDKLTKECTDCDLKIFLTHQPRQFLIDKAEKENYDLYFAGHTHGGQLSFLFPFVNLSPTLLETKYVRGDFIINEMMVTVTRGLGMSIAPIRYNSTPEITLVVLTNKE